MPASVDHKSLKSFSSSRSSLKNSRSLRSTNTHPVPSISVITTPPWAKDEPPSPLSEDPSSDRTNPLESRPSDLASCLSSDPDLPGSSRWWTFNRTRPIPPLPSLPNANTPQHTSNFPNYKPERRGIGLRERSMSWLPNAVTNLRPFENSALGYFPSIREKHKENSPNTDDEPAGPSNPPAPPRREHDWNMAMPTPLPMPNNANTTMTPGWGAPWSPGLNELGLPDSLSRQDGNQEKHMTPWKRWKKKMRRFFLTNTYIPLLFRLSNVTLTTAALAIAIRIRSIELRNGVLGAVGSSPILVIIFAPLTLTHVMAAIYLEYFGRPLGLWRTSAKLAHTLSEVLFICAWSAALSLCFDNFSTSNIPCTSVSATSWYNHIPRPTSPLPNLGRHEGGPGDRICDLQIALICMVFLGLVMYCSNLVISLYRIFEKIKVHTSSSSRP